MVLDETEKRVKKNWSENLIRGKSDSGTLRTDQKWKRTHKKEKTNNRINERNALVADLEK